MLPLGGVFKIPRGEVLCVLQHSGLLQHERRCALRCKTCSHVETQDADGADVAAQNAVQLKDKNVIDLLLLVRVSTDVGITSNDA